MREVRHWKYRIQIAARNVRQRQVRRQTERSGPRMDYNGPALNVGGDDDENTAGSDPRFEGGLLSSGEKSGCIVRQYCGHTKQAFMHEVVKEGKTDKERLFE